MNEDMAFEIAKAVAEIMNMDVDDVEYGAHFIEELGCDTNDLIEIWMAVDDLYGNVEGAMSISCIMELLDA